MLDSRGSRLCQKIIYLKSSPLRPRMHNVESISARQGLMSLSWTAQNDASPLPIASGRGALFDHDGQRWFDFESQVFNCNLGHQDERVIKAIQAQAQSLACAHPAAV